MKEATPWLPSGCHHMPKEPPHHAHEKNPYQIIVPDDGDSLEEAGVRGAAVDSKLPLPEKLNHRMRKTPKLVALWQLKKKQLKWAHLQVD